MLRFAYLFTLIRTRTNSVNVLQGSIQNLTLNVQKFVKKKRKSRPKIYFVNRVTNSFTNKSTNAKVFVQTSCCLGPSSRAPGIYCMFTKFRQTQSTDTDPITSPKLVWETQCLTFLMVC